MEIKLFEPLNATVDKIKAVEISAERQNILQPLVTSLQNKLKKDEPINLSFICTHNSRRSHLAQVWAQLFANFYGLSNVQCYSGGTEVTRLFPKVAEVLANQGFQVKKTSGDTNQVYIIKGGPSMLPIICFSKVFNDAFNPAENFIAIMTCGSADQNCPLVPGADERFVITYDDPKSSDGTPLMNETYQNKSLEIASEMNFVFKQLQPE